MHIASSTLCIMLTGLFLTPVTAPAETLRNHPISVVYDSVYQCYLVSNAGEGNIVQIDNMENESYFSTELDRTLGLEIDGDILYAVPMLNHTSVSSALISQVRKLSPTSRYLTPK